MISVIACIDSEGGMHGDMPQLNEDMRHFRQITYGQVCLAGHKTYEQLKHLPDREWYDYHYHALDGIKDKIIVGGRSVFDRYIELADIVYLTVIHNESYGCDKFFPYFNPVFNYVIERSDLYEQDDIYYSITKYVKICD